MNIIDEYNFYMDSVSEGDLYQINNFDFPMTHVVLHGNNKDESELDYAIKNNVGYIVVDNYAELDLIEKVKYAPLQSKYKVYIIDEVHMLTQGAFNALLKH